MQTAYVVVALKEILDIVLLGSSMPLAMKWAPGMIGAFAVFKDKQAALDYASGEERLVAEITLDDRQLH